jgi:hypothetical protein
MVDYVEFPFDLVRNVVVPKKKPDDGGGGTGDEHGPCGMWTSVPRAGGVFSPQANGLFALHQGTRTLSDGTVEKGLVWSHVSHVQDGFYVGGIDYLWNTPASFTVSFSDQTVVEAEVLIYVWRNTNPYNFFACENAPDYRGSTVEILLQQPTEQYPPMFALIAKWTSVFGENCANSGATVKVQGHCEDEIDGALPPSTGLGTWFSIWIEKTPSG